MTSWARIGGKKKLRAYKHKHKHGHLEPQPHLSNLILFKTNKCSNPFNRCLSDRTSRIADRSVIGTSLPQASMPLHSAYLPSSPLQFTRWWPWAYEGDIRAPRRAIRVPLFNRHRPNQLAPPLLNIWGRGKKRQIWPTMPDEAEEGVWYVFFLGVGCTA